MRLSLSRALVNATTLAFLSVAVVGSFVVAAEPNVSPLKLYSDRFDPADRPDVARYYATPPTWATFDGKTQFIACRAFPSKDDVGRDFGKTLDQYQKEELGRVIWPHASTIFFKNLGELADEINRRDLYLFDFWGFVPGSGPRDSGDWTEFKADPAQFKLLEEKLGDRWLGMDNGEQDGRYVGGYGPFASPISDDRFAQYLNFQRHFERMGDQLGNRLATLVSLNFGHYFLKEGIYTLIGAETAQGLPNGQIYYSWIRGAGKQYGVLWFGNASIYNRFSWKSYPDKATEGTTLALLKRLMYSHLLYNCAAVGYEAGWFVGEGLGPIGKIQQSAKRWLDENGDPGVQATPVAFLCDFNCGWSFPRHLYSGASYRVWGNIPYAPGDYLTNNLFDLAYPGYQDSSYYLDERGFITPTPYGDCVDALLTDAPLELLKEYATIFIADSMTPGAELYDKLTSYVKEGGRLVMTADLLEKFGGFADVGLVSGKTTQFGAEPIQIDWNDGTQTTETRPFEAKKLVLPENATIMARVGETPLVAEVPFGKGAAVVLASPFGLSTQRAFEGTVPNQTEKPLPNPYPLLDFAKKTFAGELERATLFEAGDGLASIVCRKGANSYTVGVFNNDWAEKPFKIESKIGEIASIREMPTDVGERSALGFYPHQMETQLNAGNDTEATIAGGGVRIFAVELKGETIEPLEKTVWNEPPKGRFLAIRDSKEIQTPLKESILARPTFFQHWDGVLVDRTYFEARSTEELEKEAGWIKRQKLRIAVDLTSGINLYPGLRLIHNDEEAYERSMNSIRSTIEKAAILGSESILLKTHRTPENNYSGDAVHKDVVGTLKEICAFAAERKIGVQLRIDGASPRWGIPGDSLESAVGLINEVGADNLTLAPSLYVISDGLKNADLWAKVQPKLGQILAAGWSTDENNGGVWTDAARLVELDDEQFQAVFEAAPENVPVTFYAVYKDADEEYYDVKRWKK